MIAPEYRARVELLLRLLPEVAKERAFALKGGTAINLFVRDMPRLSVDIDLTYLPFDDRNSSMAQIADALRRIKKQLDAAGGGISTRVTAQGGGQEAKLICQRQGAAVKVEVNTVLRGHLWPTRELELVQSAQDEFGMFAAATVISHAELFGGKICAALDRQHPRDLFDIQQLLDNEGFGDDVRLGFVSSLLSHTRPMHELLQPKFQDQRGLFETQFTGMTIEPYSYAEFEAIRERLVDEIHSQLQDEERELLLSVKRGEPHWNLFPVAGLDRMPAVQWKLANIQKLKKNAPKHAEQLKALEDALGT
jgi:predicted nucleotidyltransferase component of viral defense system